MENKKNSPIRFNPLKHHRNAALKALSENSLNQVIALIDPICNNYVDIYTGDLTPQEIVEQTFLILKLKGVLLRAGFTKWIAVERGLCQIRLSDSSDWILRLGNDPEKYIHLHPARTGLHTIRVKGSTLKTIYLLKQAGTKEDETPSLQLVNRIRQEAGLSPVKKLEKGKGILACLEKFFGPETSS